ncbi:MFS transporter [Blastococcus saxobsidens]|uniref:DHA1 family inner membrane transport protein n=1 Tax=Blastococcus saxobsidens TaxID=138336 RepID=A0A4Q7YBS8_9ACTN|nr:MFS transporter [Blastococcus saxobsidens]RZU33639.1 DHA1 family inner membrane transport protein [Blastococcus saxobsidens]
MPGTDALRSDVAGPDQDRSGGVRALPLAERPPLSAGRLVAAVVALGLGGFAIGTTEFVTMGLLPDIAEGIGVDIPTAGHVISLYALGVVVGAPVIAALGTRLPRRGLLLGLMAAFLVGNALTAVAPGYGSLLVARFLAGVPHGAYFGVASLVAASLVAPHLRGRAVSSVMLGLALANVAGVPAATWLGQQYGWRSAYWAVVVIAALTVAAVTAVVPGAPGNRAATVRSELGALRRPQVLLTLLVGVVGFGGMFAVYSYIAPLVTEVTGLSRGLIPWVLFAFGAGGVVGTALGGKLADAALFRSLVGANVVTGVLLALVPLAARTPVSVFAVIFAFAVSASALVVCLQMRLMEVAGEAQMLGAALNHSALNAANALGAWIGGVVIAAGYGYTAPGPVGAGLAVLGLLALTASAVLRRRELRALADARPAAAAAPVQVAAGR